MTEAYWGDTTPPDIDWRMSAALENVPRGDTDVAEVTSLETAVRTWTTLDPEHQRAATLMPEHALQIGPEGAVRHFTGDAIAALAALLPTAGRAAPVDDDPTAA